MSENPVRILIVDDQRELARALRTHLELLNRGYLIADVPSGEEALLECQRFTFDLLIVDFRLPGMTGAELIHRARKRTPDLPAIVITGVPLYEVERECKGLDILGIFQKPMDIDAFIARVDEFLMGDTPLPEFGDVQVRSIAPASFDQFPVERVLSALLGELGAQAIALINGVGKVLLKEGSFDAALRFGDLSLLLAANFLTTGDIGSFLGKGASGAVHYYTGKYYDVFALSAGKNHFLAIIYPGNNQKQMGAVLRLGKAAAERIGAMLAESGPKPPNGKVHPHVEEPVVGMQAEETPRTSLVEEIRALKRLEAEEAARQVVEDEPAPLIFAELLEDDADSSEIHLNFDELDADLTDLDDLDGFWDQTSGDASGTGSEAISLDEAMELGLLPNDLEE